MERDRILLPKEGDLFTIEKLPTWQGVYRIQHSMITRYVLGFIAISWIKASLDQLTAAVAAGTRQEIREEAKHEALITYRCKKRKRKQRQPFK